MFAQKYSYLDMSWQCSERQEFVVAVFKYNRDRYLDLRPEQMVYAKGVKFQDRNDLITNWALKEF